MTERRFAALREASFYVNPGRASRYHICVGDYMAACYPNGVLLNERTSRPAVSVPVGMRCRRPGCKKLWPAEGYDD